MGYGNIFTTQKSSYATHQDDSETAFVSEVTGKLDDDRKLWLYTGRR
jgi:hypothetical protein